MSNNGFGVDMDALRDGLREMRDSLAAMEGGAVDNDTLRQIAQDDQQDTEPDRLAGRVGTFYRRLLADDVPQATAAKCAREYNGYVLERHFGMAYDCDGEACE